MVEEDGNSFDHEFSGLSVWLEPCPDEAASLIDEMDTLSRQCGGEARGLHCFAPHCTLLYNISNPFDNNETNSNLCSPYHPNGKINESTLGKQLLEDCVSYFEAHNLPNDSEANMTLDPTSFFYFEYPKTADS
eukprot:CAMPEP_0197458570 /NCGR_PEP_ID=MMETSP1175-20131217/49057_1 /TAXON_ID=1003142 /ORGANISM="Triceratium dubium, Strain CCMP147" /LENGTH=132 /DNA_ID=CAMNT_0042993241 /DNA_START=83 /DNA_END=477 /DNA_ORIENTATION=-